MMKEYVCEKKGKNKWALEILRGGLMCTMDYGGKSLRNLIKHHFSELMNGSNTNFIVSPCISLH